MAESSTRLYLLRHGRPEGGEGFRGRIDPPLSHSGYRMMQAMLQARPDPDRVISSPLKRCADFARDWAKARQLPLQLEPGIEELDFGQWDGQSYEQVWRDAPDQLQAFWCDPYRHGPPGGEDVAAFEQRVTACVDEWLAQYVGQSLLVVAHGGVLRALIKWALSLPAASLTHLQAFEVGYAGLLVLDVYTDATGRHWPRLHELVQAPVLPKDSRNE